MRVHEFIREELVSFDTIGDMSRRDYLYRGNQASWATSSAQQEKIRQFFSRTPYKFRIFFSNQLPGARARHKIDKSLAVQIVGTEMAEKIFSNTRNAITLVLAGASVGDPLTPWMMAHQIGEALTSRGNLNKLYRTVYRYLNAIVKNCYGMKPQFQPPNTNILNPVTAYRTIRNRREQRPVNYGSPQLPDEVLPSEQNLVWMSLLKHILTFRSARVSTAQPDEMCIELLVQYINTGNTVKFNALPREIESPNGKLQLQPGCPDLFTEMINAINQEIISVLNSAVGSVYALADVPNTDQIRSELKQKIGQDYISEGSRK